MSAWSPGPGHAGVGALKPLAREKPAAVHRAICSLAAGLAFRLLLRSRKLGPSRCTRTMGIRLQRQTTEVQHRADFAARVASPRHQAWLTLQICYGRRSIRSLPRQGDHHAWASFLLPDHLAHPQTYTYRQHMEDSYQNPILGDLLPQPYLTSNRPRADICETAKLRGSRHRNFEGEFYDVRQFQWPTGEPFRPPSQDPAPSHSDKTRSFSHLSPITPHTDHRL